jgi:hypothetical protein
VTYEIRNGWVEGKLRGLNGDLFPVKHFPQGPYDRRQRGHPRLCLHTTETGGYVQNLRFPSEFQVGEGIIGQHKPLWARGEAVDELDEQVLQVEIVGRSQLGVWLPRPTSLNPLVALLALLHRRHFVATARVRPSENRWPLELDRLPPGRVLLPPPRIWTGHSSTGTLRSWRRTLIGSRLPALFSMVRSVLNDGKERDVALTETQKEGIQFANGMKRYLEGGSEPTDPGPHRRGWRFARDMKEHAAHPIDPRRSRPSKRAGTSPGAATPKGRRRCGRNCPARRGARRAAPARAK